MPKALPYVIAGSVLTAGLGGLSYKVASDSNVSPEVTGLVILATAMWGPILSRASWEIERAIERSRL